RAFRRGAAVLRSGRAARAGPQHCSGPGSAPPRTTQYVDVTFSSRRHSVPEELSRGHAFAARGVSVSESRPVGFGRCVPDGLLITTELRTPSPRRAGRDRGGISPPLSF